MSLPMRAAVRVALVLLLAAVLLPAVAAACPNCQDAASDTDTAGGSANLGRGFYWSILLMIAAPFTVVGSCAVAILRARRRREREGPPSLRPPLPGRPDSRPPGARA